MVWLEIILYLTAAILVALLVFAFIRRNNFLSPLYILLILAVLVYVLGYANELVSRSLEEAIFWIKLQYFGIPYLSFLWLLLTYRLCYGRSLSFPVVLAAGVIPVLTTFFNVTNEYHHLFYTNVSILQISGITITQLAKGPLYYVHIVYTNLLMLVGIAMIIQQLRRTKKTIHSMLFWLAFGLSIEMLLEAIYLAGLSPHNMDLMAFGFLGVVICQGVAIYRFDFLRSDDLVKDIIFSNIKEGLLVLDKKDRISDFNRTAQRIYPWLNVDSLGRKITDFEAGKELHNLNQQDADIGVRLGNKDRFFSVHTTDLVESGRRLGKVYLFNDVTAVRKIMRKLYHYANYDSLTGIFNRRRFLEEGEKEVSRCIRYHTRIAYIMIDLDNFKRINDQHGHQAGDKVLHAVAHVMSSRLRKSDIIGRYGGEEFGIFLVEIAPENALVVAEDIRQSIEGLTIEYRNASLKVTASIGVATADGDTPDLSLEYLLNKADFAMYKAKQQGGNQVSVAR
ncbi:MAG TPA: diguanylate cyclase [Spirochaetales bacterium]|nr:diguanylate cyclase [Spirochaetales bacterium]